MNYVTELPEGFRSWFQFYEAIRTELVKIDGDDYYWHPRPSNSIFRSRPLLSEYKYSVRHIERQVLSELYDLRKLQTFNYNDLLYLRYALQTSISLTINSDPRLVGLERKVDELLQHERNKKVESHEY